MVIPSHVLGGVFFPNMCFFFILIFYFLPYIGEIIQCMNCGIISILFPMWWGYQPGMSCLTADRTPEA